MFPRWISLLPTRLGPSRGSIFRSFSENAVGPVEAEVLLVNSLEEIIQPVESETYGSCEATARTRLANRDSDDWPILAPALALSSPIWTEDNDFLGAGVATWPIDRVELFLGTGGPSG